MGRNGVELAQGCAPSVLAAGGQPCGPLWGGGGIVQ